MLQYWNFNTSKRTFGRFGWTLLKGNSATQAGATAWHANSTLQHKSPSCASHAINTLDLTSRIEATYCRFTVVEKKPELHHVFSRENGQNFWHLTKTCQITNLGFLLTLRSPIPVCLHALIMRFPLPLLLFSNDYMPTCQGLIDCVRNECANTNLSRNK